MMLRVVLPLLIGSAVPIWAQSAGIAPAINQLGLDLVRAQSAGSVDTNLLLSPYSIESALTMAWAGADGRTREEMRRVLHLAGGDTAVVDGLAALTRQLAEVQAASRRRAEAARRHGSPGTPVELNVANRLFAQSGFALRPAFTGLLRDRFGAPLEELDFARAAEPARVAINQWVAKETRDRIRDIVPQGALNADTRAVLANAIYLKAPWKDPFTAEATTNGPFWVRGATAADVPMMQQLQGYRYEKHGGFTALALPYDGGELQFLILLPDQRDGLAQLENDVTPELLAGCAKMPWRGVILHLPRFKLEPPSTPLGTLLRGLGMTTAFDQPPGSANFDRMAPHRADAYLYLSEVFHQTWLALDEHGTEAAAATVAVIALSAARPGNVLSPVEVRVDHPFVFAIQHVASGTCLFLGRVNDPR